MNKTELKRLGFKRHKGGKCPVAPDQYVELLIHTSEGLGSSGVGRADDHEWEDAKLPDGIGRVRLYRFADKHDEPLVGIRHRFADPA